MAVSNFIVKRLEEKKADFTKYSFSRVESNALKAFFDLAQEVEKIEDVYQASVAVPKAFFGMEARLYVVYSDSGKLELAASTEDGPTKKGSSPPDHIRSAAQPYALKGSMVLTIRGNRQFIEELPFKTQDDVLGILEVYPYNDRDPHKELFFEKYANRIGFSVHIRFLLQKNMEHVRFIKGLVADIEHNVIVPNMVYKLYLRRLGGKIKKNQEIERGLEDLAATEKLQENPPMAALLAELSEVNQAMMEEFDNIDRHYKSSSLFLETLLRKSHFDEGRLTLRTMACNIKEEVVRPQLERFIGRLAKRGVEIEDHFNGFSAEESVAVVDVGLLAQVYGNLFSNALKYTSEVTTATGEKKKFVSFGRKRLPDYFGPGMDGIRYNVFTTGPHIPEGERETIFQEGYRGSNVSSAPGTGHGLAFVKNAVEIHEGVAGYEAVPDGNDFYFVLPD